MISMEGKSVSIDPIRDSGATMILK